MRALRAHGYRASREPLVPSPFQPGSRVMMRESGWSVGLGEIATIEDCRWVEDLQEWCVAVRVPRKGASINYRARRFKLADEGETMKHVWSIFELVNDADGGKSVMKETSMIFEGSDDEVHQYTREMIKSRPSAMFAFGKLTETVRITEPPVQFDRYPGAAA